MSVANQPRPLGPPTNGTSFSTRMDSEPSPTLQSSPTHYGSSPNLPSSPVTCVNDTVIDTPIITTIQTNFKKSLNMEFKPGRVSQEELIYFTELERNIAEAAIIPQNLDDFTKKVILLH